MGSLAEKTWVIWISGCVLTLVAGCIATLSSESSDDKKVAEPTIAADKTVDLEPDVKNRPVESKSRGYIKSASCKDCHPHHYDTWHSSHHRTMTQVPTRESVIADFDNKVIRHSGREFRFFHEEDDFYMELKSPPPKSGSKLPQIRTFKIVLSTGAHHQQAFWCETGKERTLGKIPFIWITKEQRWIPYGSIFLMPKTGLSMHAGMWNQNCIKCHVVGGQPRLDPELGYDSQVAEFGISCEACHGPGDAHAQFHGGPNADHSDDLLLGKEELVNPAKLSHVKSSHTCGQCHSIFEFYDDDAKTEFNQQGFAYRPGDDLLDSRHVFRFGKDKDLPIVKKKLERNPKFYERQFWSDGMVRVSGREYNGLLETPCYQRGTMSCLTCHDMHPSEQDNRPRDHWADDQLKPKMRDNQACLQCHQEYKSEDQLVLHTHHSANSAGSNCYNCHMPHTTLGLMKAMRSHTIDSPNVKTTVSTGRPNACNLCHLDKTLKWTSEHLEDWYQIPAPELSDEEKKVASSVRWLLKGDAGQRAITGWHYGWDAARKASGDQWMAPYMAELLNDPYDVVRFNGYHSLKELPGFSRFEYDFVGSLESQNLARQQVLKKWAEQSTRPAPARRVLIGAEGRLLEERFQKLRNERVDPPMVLVE